MKITVSQLKKIIREEVAKLGSRAPLRESHITPVDDWWELPEHALNAANQLGYTKEAEFGRDDEGNFYLGFGLTGKFNYRWSDENQDWEAFDEE